MRRSKWDQMPSQSECEWDDDALAVLADMEANAETICEHAGHEWGDAGGGLLICTVCTAEKWEDERG
jgi:hypothetical protein